MNLLNLAASEILCSAYAVGHINTGQEMPYTELEYEKPELEKYLWAGVIGTSRWQAVLQKHNRKFKWSTQAAVQVSFQTYLVAFSK